MESQEEFWEGQQVLKRRHPSHRVIEAFAWPKVKRIASVTGASEGQGSPMKLLDVGAGNGYFSYYLQRFFNVTALDFSRAILSICPIEDKVQASALNLPFTDNAFDIVFCSNLLHHIDDPYKVIAEMKRVSSRYIAIVEPNRLNPLMVAVALISPEDRKVLKYSTKYMRSLVEGELNIILHETSGFILPNKTPEPLLPFFRFIEPFIYPKIYQLLVAE